MKTLKLVVLASIAIIAISCEDDDPIRVLDIDLQATAINFSIEKETDFAGTATITGIVTNIGSENFVSATNQQRILLYERPFGSSSAGSLIGEVNFTSLNAGEQLTVSYTRNWNSSSPDEGEFPPNYVLQITYDPDIAIDGNENNDDKNSANNSLTESGTAINDLF
ncbi:MAG: hypothetical protein CL613_02290 [Aquimarina sp.]|nr:hypothetical protein [Aquimarina sp.]